MFSLEFLLTKILTAAFTKIPTKKTSYVSSLDKTFGKGSFNTQTNMSAQEVWFQIITLALSNSS